MPSQAMIIRVLIASPSDVAEERQLVCSIIHEWNGLNAIASGIVLLPVMWETHSRPEMGERPQAIINRQLVEQCDAMIGLFWTRIGTSTEVSESGTVEEIEQFIVRKCPTMLYFSTRPLVPDNLDLTQFERLKHFRTRCLSQGLVDTFDSLSSLARKIPSHLTSLVREFGGRTEGMKELVPPGGQPYQVLQRGPGGELVWDWLRFH